MAMAASTNCGWVLEEAQPGGSKEEEGGCKCSFPGILTREQQGRQTLGTSLASPCPSVGCRETCPGLTVSVSGVQGGGTTTNRREGRK